MDVPHRKSIFFSAGGGGILRLHAISVLKMDIFSEVSIYLTNRANASRLLEMILPASI